MESKIVNPITNEIITIKHAKEICKNKLNRMIRPGYEIMIISDIDKNNYPFEIYLYNESGKYKLRIWRSINPVSYHSNNLTK